VVVEVEVGVEEYVREGDTRLDDPLPGDIRDVPLGGVPV
jgi:hypothetical protein